MGTCDGDQTQTEVCAEQEVCPLENDNTTLILVLGGETSRENRENEHSTSVEILGPSGLCRLSEVPDLPEARGKMSGVCHSLTLSHFVTHEIFSI